MSIPAENLEPPRWGGPVPQPVDRPPLVLAAPDPARTVVVDPPVVLSPMAGVTNPPYRKVCREMGAGLVCTEMLSARMLAAGDARTMAMLDVSAAEHPVSVQIFGKDPAAMADAAAIVVAAGADVVDVNMGCPMRKVVSSGYGAALLQTPRLVRQIFEAMREAVDVPLTGKLRAGWQEASAVDVARAMADGGAQAVTIHGRTRSEMYDGHADLGVIAELVAAVDLKVVGNGDVRDWVSARRMFQTTGCDAVMVARGALGNPWVFAEIAADLAGDEPPQAPAIAERRRVLSRHVDLYVEAFGEAQMCREIRKHLLWYFRHTPAEKVLRRRLSGLESRADVDAAIAAACQTCESTTAERSC